LRVAYFIFPKILFSALILNFGKIEATAVGRQPAWPRLTGFSLLLSHSAWPLSTYPTQILCFCIIIWGACNCNVVGVGRKTQIFSSIFHICGKKKQQIPRAAGGKLKGTEIKRKMELA